MPLSRAYAAFSLNQSDKREQATVIGLSHPTSRGDILYFIYTSARLAYNKVNGDQ